MPAIVCQEAELLGQETTVPARHSWSRTAMHWIRRIHLFSGLFMFPWVMLYGTTALLFNHPGAFPDQARLTLYPEDFAGTALERVADPAADAEKVVAALKARIASRGLAKQMRLVQPEKAVYARDRIVARVRGQGQEHNVVLELPSGIASVGTTMQPDGQGAPFAVRGLKVPGALGERVKSGLPKALARQGLAAEEAGISIGSELVFFVEVDGRVWRASYSSQTGAVTGRPAENGPDLSTRRFLTSLHMSHGFPSQGGMRWAWALAVDAMFVAMVFWGFSGLLMWWQIRAVRIMGAMVLVSSLIIATLVALGMHRILSAS